MHTDKTALQLSGDRLSWEGPGENTERKFSGVCFSFTHTSKIWSSWSFPYQEIRLCLVCIQPYLGGHFISLQVDNTNHHFKNFLSQSSLPGASAFRACAMTLQYLVGFKICYLFLVFYKRSTVYCQSHQDRKNLRPFALFLCSPVLKFHWWFCEPQTPPVFDRSATCLKRSACHSCIPQCDISRGRRHKTKEYVCLKPFDAQSTICSSYRSPFRSMFISKVSEISKQ